MAGILHLAAPDIIHDIISNTVHIKEKSDLDSMNREVSLLDQKLQKYFSFFEEGCQSNLSRLMSKKRKQNVRIAITWHFLTHNLDHVYSIRNYSVIYK